MKTLHWSWLWQVIIASLVLLSGLGATPTPGADGYRIAMRRNFGYGGGSQIRGDFTISVIPQEGVAEVVFFIDDTPMATVNAAPFRYRFNTSDYPLGWHTFKARITTLDGEVVETPVRRFEFVSAEVERSAVVRFLVPLLGGVFLLTVLGVGLQMLLLGRKPGTLLPLGAPRRYGISGGAICPRCGRATPMHWWAINLGLRRLDRCEACGRWSLMRRATPAELQAAEEAERRAAAQEETTALSGSRSPEDELRDLLDRSRFLD